MNMINRRKAFLVTGLAVVAALAMSQFKLGDVVKVLGVGAAVKQFGPQINKEFNKLTRHSDTEDMTTKVVPILSIGLGGGSSAIGAAQVMGPRSKVEKVQAVAQPEAKIFGEIRIRALIPVESKDVIKNIKKVDGVGVSGIVDLKL